jgi:hypothetical protein
MGFLGFLLIVPILIVTKTFAPALAFAANHFTIPFNHVPFAITSDTDHFNPPLQECAYGAIERVLFTGFGPIRWFLVVSNKKIMIVAIPQAFVPRILC